MKTNKVQVRVMRGVAVLAVLGVMFWTLVPHLLAQDLSPEGRWKTVSDKTGKATSVVRVWIDDGELRGKVEELIRKPGQNPNPMCKKCQGEKKDQPVKGMTILWGFTQDEDEWNGGYILDPDNGKTYRCIVRVVDNGRKLHVRGYIGFSLFGRTQVWHRAE